ncbi:TolC family protein [Dysgonomonas sp. ZJ279]|uniref:TolC family protein n=1 Tax=Dysgonomonas sp. ZJ279 TaxID=2709796 RepID=UPI0013EB0C20|nr:TolC family protein [Dysgonomonas sp. ZJ279]
MKRIIFSIILSFTVLTIDAQSGFEQVLNSIEANNTTLKALREQANADKIGNKTGLTIANPEVEFGYLWGSPGDTGNRTDLNVTQSFDFPTAYRHKSQLAQGKNRQVDLNYDQQRREVLQEARLLCVELTYQIKINKLLTERLKYAKELSAGYQTMFDEGDINVLERNKTKLNLLSAEKALQINEVEINTIKSELRRMNGGISIENSLDAYPQFAFPLNFDEWFVNVKENNSLLQLAEQEVVLSRKQEQLTRALNMPKFNAGYTSERILGTVLQGFTIGVSIPLWEGKNTVKHQKAQTIALQMQQEDYKLQFRNKLKNEYEKAYKLSLFLKEYENALSITNNHELLARAFDRGQLSLINYLLEVSVYYETVDKYLETERDYHLAVIELLQWER